MAGEQKQAERVGALIRATTRGGLLAAAMASLFLWILFQSPPVPAGLFCGTLLALVTIHSWGWLLAGLSGKMNWALLILATAGKLGLYAAAFYFLVYHPRVNILSLAGGFLVPVLLLSAMAVRNGTAPLAEVAR